MSKVFTLALLTIGLVPVVAQGQGVTFGLKGGFSSGNQDRTVATEAQSGIQWGAFAAIRLSDLIALQPEISMVGKGGEIETSTTSFGIEQSYLDFPVLLKLTVPALSRAIRPVLFVGPVISFELGCEAESEVGDVDGPGDTEDTDPADVEGDDVTCTDPTLGADQFPTKSVEFGALGGAGFDISLGRLVLGVEARYTLGLTNVSDLTGASAETVKNRVFSVVTSVGIRLP